MRLSVSTNRLLNGPVQSIVFSADAAPTRSPRWEPLELPNRSGAQVQVREDKGLDSQATATKAG